MFNYVNNNPVGQRIESAVSTGQEHKQRQQQQQDKEKKYLEDEDNDEVSLAPLPELTQEQVEYLTKEYIAKLKSEHENEPKVIQKLDKFLSKFDAKKFMKRNPNMTVSDFNMLMFNETSDLVN